MDKTRGIEKLHSAESLMGSPIGDANIRYLENFTRTNRVFSVDIGSASTFSKPMQFFQKQSTKFQYLVDGKLVPFNKLTDGSFIAFQLRKGVLHAFGFFPGEY